MSQNNLLHKAQEYKWYILGLLGVLVCGVAVWFAFGGYDAGGVETHTITLRSDGFHPDRLVITEGDTVVFKTTNDGPFWPASDVHPTHTAYPDFDPREPIAPDATWEYTFAEAGTYGFHDHINSTFEGEIVVERTDGSRVKVNCDTERTVQCWEKLMLETLEEERVAAALNKILELTETEPLFLNDCHGYAHLIGEEAFKLYTDKDSFELSTATALCGYGFYHGFMEVLLLTTGDIAEARAFCEVVDQKLAGKASEAATACFHGTGHGAIDGTDPTAWGDPDAMMAPGFKVCDLLSETVLETYLCETGVYNAIEILSRDPKYEIGFIADDPYAFCNTQTVERREGCYSNMFPLVLDMFKNDIAKSAEYINDRMIDHEVIAIDGHTINELVTIGLMFEYIRIHGEEEGYMEEGIALCRTQPEDDRLACIEGLSGGHLKYGTPGEEYIGFLELCGMDILTQDEKDACYEYTMLRLGGRYEPAKTAEICSMVEPRYREQYCNL